MPYIILISITTLLTILGPFGTGDLLSYDKAFLYWLAIVTGTYFIGFLINVALAQKLPNSTHFVFKIAACTLISTAIFTPYIGLVSYAAFDQLPQNSNWSALATEVFSITFIINFIFVIIKDRMRKASTAQNLGKPVLLDRLPQEKRGAIIALSSQDHYTLVQTTKGDELVLIRLVDAIREAEPTQGSQVHRSHWVALNQVTAARRDGARAILTLSSEVEIPVSRSFIDVVKDKGLLAR
jgi:hypothetical protein